MAVLVAGVVAVLAAACGPAPPPTGPDGPARRIVSLDYCADQYVLGLVERGRILALSPDAGEAFSYLRAEAEGIPVVRPRAEDVLILRPDLVVRSYGGGPRAGGFFEQAGISVLQIDYAPDIASVRAGIRGAAARLDAAARGEALIAEMDARLERARARGTRTRALYLTPAGVSSGAGTFVDDLIAAAGLDNFDDRNGWRSIPLERLAYEAPDVYAVPSFGATNHRNAWTPFRHPVATERVAAGPTLPIDGSTTACGGWFLAGAVEALAAGADAS
ncbi:MAG: ABC transporter substrate-binding protein [Acidobacteria bacterium]|nr:ABC transporter substrate-binding protein [Acidobacteriota bacterium]